MYKLAVVEDENDIRSRIVDMIKNSGCNFYISSEYANGIDAYDGIVSDNPDLILTDIRIPGIGGIELAKMVRRSLPFVKIIFITGFSEFEYAKEAANLGVIGFISKPVGFDELMTLLEKAEQALDDEYLTASSINKLSDFYESNLPTIRDNDLYRLSKMSEVPVTFDRKLKSNGISLDYNFFMVGIFDFDTIREGEGEHYELAYSSIRKTIDEEFNGLFDFEMFNRYEKFCFILKSDTPPDISKLNRHLEHIVQRIGRYSGMTVSVGVSSVFEKNKNFATMYKEAMRALIMRSVMGGNNVFFFRDIATTHSQLSVDDKMIRELGYMMHFHPLQKCLERIDEIWSNLEDAKVPLLYVSTNILNVLIKACNDLDGLYSLYGGKDSDSLYSGLFQITNDKDALLYLKNLAQIIANLNDGAIIDNMEYTLRKIMFYMENHFCDPEISFESLAKNVNFSTNYIGVLLKKKLNTSFVKMLTSLRMEKAKTLLTDSSLKIADVSEQLGYKDSYYFSHCFKKYVGVSPREFKNSGQIK
jgi:two-component system response regulator YesN